MNMATANPYADTKVKQGIAAQRTNDMIESLRKNARKIIEEYGCSMEGAISFMATITPPLEEAALNTVNGIFYLDKITTWCMGQINATIPQTVGEGKPRVKGHGANRHVDTGAIVMPQRTGKVNHQEPLMGDKPAEPIERKDPFGNPLPAEIPAVQVPQEIIDMEAHIKEQAATPDTSDLIALKAATAVPFEADELTGKDDPIDGEIISEETTNEADAAFGPKTEREPLPLLDPQKEVARILTEAFPDATPDYKLHFFREAVGYKLVIEAVLAMGASDMYRTLNDAIREAKANPIETPIEPKPSVEIATEKGTQNGQGDVATNMDSDKPLSPQTVPQSPTISALPSVISKTENALAISEPSRSRLIPTREECEFVFGYSRAVAASRFYKGVDTPEKAQVIMFKGLSIGIQALDALDGFDVIDDPKRGISLFPRVKLLRGLVERTGKCRRFDIAGDDKKCTVTIQREGRGINTYTFTMEDARAMHLTNKYNWEAMPARMLMWRACSLAIAADFPEVMYSFGQSATNVDDEDVAA